MRPLAMWWLCAASAVRLAGTGRVRSEQFPDMEKCAAGDASPDYSAVSKLLGEARGKVQAQLSSTHFVALLPATAGFSTGEALVSADAYMRLPVQGGSSAPYLTKLTKVVLLGTSDSGSGLSVADCGLTDTAAADWLRDKSEHMVNGIQLQASAPLSQSHTNQVPFLSLLFEGRLAGNVLPLVLADQTAQTAQQTADLLATLVGAGGPWSEHRVLFALCGDLSRDLEKKWAIPRDQETVDLLVKSSFGEVLSYFDKLKGVQLPGEHRRPYDFAVSLMAVKLASELGMVGSPITVANSGDYVGQPDRNELDKVHGYASVLYGHDGRSAGEKLSAGPQQAELPATTTTTTTVAPTVVPPPTVIPADQLSMTPGPMLYQARLRHHS